MSSRISVKGTLRNLEGQPVANAVVMIVDGPESFNDMASVSDDAGGFTLSHIAVPGTYKLQIQSDRGSFTKEISVQGPEPVQITL